MERCLAIVESGVVANVIVVDPTDTETIAHYGGLLLPEGSAVGIGWTYDGVKFIAPPKYNSLAEALAAKLQEIEQAYQHAVGADIQYMGATFQSDADSRALTTSVLMASGGALPLGFVWYDKANAPVPMTFADLQALAGAILLRGQPLFVTKQTRKAEARAAQTIQQLESI